MKRELINVFKTFNRKKRSQPVILIEKREDSHGNVDKVCTYIEDSDFRFWISKKPLENYQTSVPLGDVEEVHCKYSELYKTLAKIGNEQSLYRQAMKDGDFSALNQLHFNKDIHYSDVELCDYLIYDYSMKHKKDVTNFPIHKAFFDIEVDAVDLDGFPEPEEALCPINFISYVDSKDKHLILYILLNDKNESQNDFIKRNQGECTNLWTHQNNEWCKQALDTYFQDEKNPELSMEKFTIYWFKSELSLIKKFYKKVHNDKPDFLAGYNTYFDAMTIKTRLEHHGVEPEDVMCPSEFPFKKVFIKEDTFSKDLDDKCDTLDITGWHHTIDLRYYFLSIRKGQGKRDSTKLDDILLEELGEGKVDLNEDIKFAVYSDFENFLLYSGFDSFRLHQLEAKNMDIELMHKASSLTFTRHDKVMRKTTSLRNLAFSYFYERGRILSNNQNKFIEHGNLGKFKGAFVADSNKINPVGTIVNGKPSSSVFEDNIDQDFTGLYPAIISTFQVGDMTLIAKVLFKDNPYLDEYFGELLNQKDVVLIGEKVFNLPTFSEIYANLDEFLE